MRPSNGYGARDKGKELGKTRVLGMGKKRRAQLAKVKLECASRESIQQMKCDEKVSIAKINANSNIVVAAINTIGSILRALIYAVGSIMGLNKLHGSEVGKRLIDLIGWLVGSIGSS